MIPEALANLRVRLWFCPVEGHSGRFGVPTQTVEWVDDIAHCLFPGCGRTSSDPVPRGFCMCDEHDCVGQCCGIGQCTCTPDQGVATDA